MKLIKEEDWPQIVRDAEDKGVCPACGRSVETFFTLITPTGDVNVGCFSCSSADVMRHATGAGKRHS